MTPANVYDGDSTLGKDRLITLLKTHPYAPIVVTTILGAPAVARWMPDERIGLALWGLTGVLSRPLFYKPVYCELCTEGNTHQTGTC